MILNANLIVSTAGRASMAIKPKIHLQRKTLLGKFKRKPKFNRLTKLQTCIARKAVRTLKKRKWIDYDYVDIFKYGCGGVRALSDCEIENMGRGLAVKKIMLDVSTDMAEI